jgi:hypothetical protein
LTTGEYGSRAPLLASDRGEYSKNAGESKTVGESKTAGESKTVGEPKMVGESTAEAMETAGKKGELSNDFVGVAEESGSGGVEMESAVRRPRRPPGLPSSSTGDDPLDALASSLIVVSQARLDFTDGGDRVLDGRSAIGPDIPLFKTYFVDLDLPFLVADNARWARRLTAKVSLRKIRSNSSG